MLDAAARSGMTEKEFWESTPGYFYSRVKHYAATVRDSWEQTRFIAYVVAKTVDSKKRILKPSDLLPLPWDVVTGKRFKKLTAAEKKAMQDFDAEADLIMQRTQPEVWANYVKLRDQAANDTNGG